MRAYSLDLRERIVAAYKRGERLPAIVAEYQVSEASVWRYVYAHRHGVDLTPKTRPGRARLITPEHEPLLAQQVRDHPDRTLEEHTTLWLEATGVQVSFKTMDRALQRLKISHKKRR